MTICSAFIKKHIYRVVFCICIFVPIGVQADILTFDSIFSKKETNGDKYNNASWTALKFEILNPVVGTRKYLNKNLISFTLDSDRLINRTRTDIRIGDDWLRKRKFKSSRNKWNNFWIGSGSLNGTQVSDLRTFDDDEKVVFAWIIANTDELINYALTVNKNMPKRSRLTWERMARGQIFERNVRRFLGPSARAALKEYDDFSHSKLILKRTIQPKLKTLNYYKGTIDGIGGPQTTKAIKAFEKANGLLIDGKLFGRERALLVKLASAETSTKKYVKKLESTDSISAAQKAEISTLKKRIDRISMRISALIKENLNLKRKINSSEKSNSGWDDDLKNTINGQKNIIKHMRIRIADLMKERNKLRDSDNGVVTTDPSDVKNLQNTTYNQRKIIKSLRERISDLIKERNKLRDIENKSGGSNKYLIQVLENELNTLNIKYNIIVSQRDELQRDLKNNNADKFESTAKNQRNIIKALRDRISSLQKENIKLQVNSESSVGSSSADKNQLSNLQDKYQDLYIKNNTIRVDFDKLDKKYKQLTSDLEAKNNKNTESLQKLNEELSVSLQKQKILAYDAISQKLDVEKKLKIALAETMEFNSQINDLSNIANANGALKNDLSQARSKINSLNDKLDVLRNSASAEFAKAVAKNAMLEVELEKSNNKYAELEKQKSSTKNGQQKGFVLSSEWDDLKQWITPQQMRFCTILSDYDREKVAAQESGNQLKQNLAIDNRDADIDALLLGRNSEEKGYFRNWIGTVEQVFAIYQENAEGVEELAAGVVIKTPCNSVTVGSGRVKSADDERYEGTAFPSDPIYSQLSQVSKGDPILFEGSLLTYQDTGEARRSSKPRFFTNVDSSVNDVEAEKAKKKNKINAPDYFVKIDYLSKL
jgi:peptidoglycan hydrolase-like protein with peptidoglycan-binding domain